MSPWSFHVPVVAVSVFPDTGVPEMVGTAVFTGAAPINDDDHVGDTVEVFPATSVAAPALTTCVKVPVVALDGVTE